MRTVRIAAAAWIAALCVVAPGAGTEARAQYSRRKPIAEAVQKTRDSIVTVKVAKPGRSRETVGTGVIVDERGYVVTNRHVVHQGTRVTVTLAGGTDVRAQVLAADPRCDLAILRLKALRPLKALLLAPGSDVMVGETVIAIGHPFGYRNTVSTGIVSALNREVEMPTGDILSGLFQTNASINPGNSGGPLLNINGELIGIITALRNGAQNIGFAINADTVKQMLSKHLSALKVAGVKHGLACTESVVAEGKDRQRVVVAAVTRGTPAADAGIRQGDEIIKVGSQWVTNRFDVERALWNSRPGEEVNLKVLRDGKLTNVTLKLKGSAKMQRLARRSLPGKQ
jgi:serine protease Do